MPPETRRAARAAAERAAAGRSAAPDDHDDSDETQRTSRGRIVGRVILIVVVLLLALAVWLVIKVVIAKNGLESAQAAVISIQDGGNVCDAIPKLSTGAADAAGAAADPVWRMAELIPGAGDNLRGVRLAAETLDVFANDVGGPIFKMQEDGQGKILARALPLIETAAPEIS